MDTIFSHPKYTEMLASGVTDEAHIKKTFQVYLDLCEVHQWWNVRLHPCQQFNVIFISGRPQRGLDREFVLTLGADQSLSPLDTHNYINRLKEFSKTEVDGLNVAVTDTDSTTAFYKLTAGLVPVPPLVAENKFKFKGHNPGRAKRFFTYPTLPKECDVEQDKGAGEAEDN
ncbi:tRNA-splicing endonuclease subunit Sen15-like [Liolophura sinensis]|uniref:tRNA-splicing endonuclease subunit Sen15-like n=1 Tax=Liolophura sinensis TaxID=3198878 RepID=UPI0031584793